MIKRFKNRGLYTLCLIRFDASGEPITWCINVSYQGRIKNTLSFSSVETHILVDTETNKAYISDFELTPLGVAHVTNIVQGWQF